MAYIPNLSTSPVVTAGVYFIGAQGNNNNAQRFSAEALANFVAEYLNIGGITSHYAAPSATAFSVELPDVTNTIWLILTPTAGFADGEIVMPAAPVDQQTVNVNCTQAVTTLVVDGNGATVTGEPAALSANGFFTLRYDAVTSTWYRIG